jgi:palmitoyltransferase
VVLGASAYALHRQTQDGASPDPYLIAAIVIAAFFGLFAFLMTVTSMRYIFLNMTNVDILGFGDKVYQLAVRVPRRTRSDKFGVIVYPLEKEAGNLTSNSRGRRADAIPAASRDDLATRTFAILQTESGGKENPWDLGFWRNWQTVMGNNPLDWLLPIRLSPCANHENHESFYPMGPVLNKVRTRYGLPLDSPSDESTTIELRNLRNT